MYVCVLVSSNKLKPVYNYMESVRCIRYRQFLPHTHIHTHTHTTLKRHQSKPVQMFSCWRRVFLLSNRNISKCIPIRQHWTSEHSCKASNRFENCSIQTELNEWIKINMKPSALIIVFVWNLDASFESDSGQSILYSNSKTF